jgi:prevent-host-death family protein
MTKSIPRGVWSISKAKANFAAFLKSVETGPQVVTVRGVPKAVALGKKEAERLGVGKHYARRSRKV